MKLSFLPKSHKNSRRQSRASHAGRRPRSGCALRASPSLCPAGRSPGARRCLPRGARVTPAVFPPSHGAELDAEEHLRGHVGLLHLHVQQRGGGGVLQHHGGRQTP